MLGNKINFNFFIRCLFAEKALKTVFFIILATILSFSFSIRVFEFDNPFDNFSSMSNVIWFSCITMTTVGYGDYLPISLYGRVLSFCLGVIGVLITYLITVILGEKLNL